MRTDDMLEGNHSSAQQCCLRKLNPVVNKNGPICPNSVFLSKDKCSTIGRGVDEVNIRLLSRKAPLMISRKHATVAFQDEVWTITDNESLNGVFVNGTKIQPSKPHPLAAGDKILFGCKFGNMQAPEFEYVFQQLPKENQMKRTWHDNVCQKNTENKKRRLQELDDDGSMSQSNTTEVLEIAQENLFDNQIKIQEEKIKQLTSQLIDKETAHKKLAQTLEKREQDLINKLEKQKQDLEVEKQEAEKQLSNLLESQLREKESKLTNQFEEQIEVLRKERDMIEKNLQEELNEKLTEKETSHTEELEKQKQALNKILNDMEIERKNREEEAVKNQELLNNLKNAEEHEKQLGCCLEELRRQIKEKEDGLQKQQDITKKAEEAGKRSVLLQMEDEFTCMICHELFVHAVTLSCAHSFCEMCLRMWIKKKNDCPVCRKRINGKAVKSLVLDSAISKMVENTDSESKQYRQMLIAERNATRDAERGIPYILIT